MYQQFKQNIDWDRGDLLYGISYARGEYIKANFPQVFAWEGHTSMSYIDDYNNSYFCLDMTQNLDPARVNDMIGSLSGQRTGISDRHTQYVQVLRQHKYSPMNTLRMNPINVLRKEGLESVVIELTKRIKRTGDPNGPLAEALTISKT